MSQFSELYAAVQDTVDDTSATALARIKRYLNWGQNDMASRKDWPWLRSSSTFNTVAGTEEYTLDATCQKLIDVRNTTKDTYLSEYVVKDFDGIHPAVSTTTDRGEPGYWYATELDASDNQKIKLYLVPDAVYAMAYRFYKKITDMETDASLPAVPAKYHKLLVDFACFKYYQKEQDPQANHFYVEYQNGIEQMMMDNMESDNIPTMKSSFERTGRDLRF